MCRAPTMRDAEYRWKAQSCFIAAGKSGVAKATSVGLKEKECTKGSKGQRRLDEGVGVGEGASISTRKAVSVREKYFADSCLLFIIAEKAKAGSESAQPFWQRLSRAKDPLPLRLDCCRCLNICGTVRPQCTCTVVRTVSRMSTSHRSVI